jgi:hypothetical protein
MLFHVFFCLFIEFIISMLVLTIMKFEGFKNDICKDPQLYFNDIFLFYRFNETVSNAGVVYMLNDLKVPHWKWKLLQLSFKYFLTKVTRIASHFH